MVLPAGVVAGLLLGGPRLLPGQQVVLGHRPPPGRALQGRGLAALAAQPRPEEVHLELHPLRVGNTVATLSLLLVNSTTNSLPGGATLGPRM